MIVAKQSLYGIFLLNVYYDTTISKLRKKKRKQMWGGEVCTDIYIERFVSVMKKFENNMQSLNVDPYYHGQ